MARGRNSKAAVQRDNARERKHQDADASALDDAVSVIERQFTGENDVVSRLAFLAAMIRQGDVDHTDYLVADPDDAGHPEPIRVQHRWAR